MSAKHTPGPWRLETAPTQLGSCHKIGPFPSCGARKETFACVYADGVRPGEETWHQIGGELLANARLIAASPDLYDGCNALLGLLQLIEGRDDVPPELREALRTNHRRIEAEAAVAKAEGRS